MTLPSVILALASIASLAAWIWLVTLAFQNGEKNWGIGLIVSAFIPIAGPVVALIFIVKFWGIARKPAFLFLGSLLMTGIGFLALMNSARNLARELGDNPEFQAALRRGGEDAENPANTPDPANAADPTSTSTLQRPPPPEPPPAPLPSPKPPRPARSTPVTAATDPTGSTPTPMASVPTVPPDTGVSPLAIDVVHLGEANPNQMRSILARARNSGVHPVREARLALSYFDARGLRLGRRMTVHTETTNIVAGLTTNEFSLQAFFVPQFTKEVRIEVESLRFPNGERWPPIDPALARPPTSQP